MKWDYIQATVKQCGPHFIRKFLFSLYFSFLIQTKERYKQSSGGVTELTKTLAQIIFMKIMSECSLVHCLEGFPNHRRNQIPDTSCTCHKVSP